VGVLPDGNVVMAWTVLSEDPSDTSSGDVHAQIFSFSPAVPGLTLTGNGLANVLTGGADNDTIAGLGGRDTLTGGGGADTFVYSAVTDSTSRSYDTIRDFDPSADSFHLWYQISGVDPEIDAGSLGSRRFDSNLASAVGNSHLAPHHAVLFTPSSGTYAGQSFLVVDANGVAGYQAGADLVIHLGANSSHLGSLSDADCF
jgi:Ca2+-binding RTX toxin-like protein